MAYFGDDDLSDVQVPITYHNTALEPVVFFDGDRFLLHLDETYEDFDVLTYSNSRASTPPLRRIKRLITNLALPVGCPVQPREIRIVVNNHAKVFLCYRSEVLQATYVGSQNLTHGTQINLMTRVDYTLNKHLLDFFDFLWTRAKKI